MSRQTGAGRTLFSALAASFILFPIVLASQQQEQQYHRESPHENGLVGEPHPSSERSRHYRDSNGRQLETTNYKHLKDTTVNSNHASAIATLAPAGVDHAVRAPQPVQGSSKSAGLSSLLHARSLQDWEVEDFVLLATVDGSIHARDRRTGAPRWALEVDRPMVETVYHRQNRSESEENRPEDDFLWIVEPSRDGDIYIYNQGHNGGLQRLGLTVKELEGIAPYASEDPAVVYTAHKMTTLYTVDAGSGNITKKFSSQGSSKYDEQSCRRVVGLEGLDEEECGSNGMLMLGRTEYTIRIENKDTAEPVCTLMYSEWGPNNRDSDLHSQYSATMDKRYVYPRHDGNIYGFDHARLDNRRQSYIQKFSTPVVGVFDVARPMEVQDRDTQLVILPQPTGPIDSKDLYSPFNDRNRIFVNRTEAGSWYAMSESNYPLVIGGAPIAPCYDRDSLGMSFTVHSGSLAQRQKALVGVHAISEHEAGHESFMTISGPAIEPINDTPIRAHSSTPALPSLPVVANSYIIGSAAANAPDIIIACIIIVIGTFISINRRVIAKMLRQNLELKTPALEQSLASVPSSPVVTEAPWSEETTAPILDEVEEALDRNVGDLAPSISRRNTLLEPPNLSRSRSGSLDEERGRTQREPRVRIQEPSPSPGREEYESIDTPNSPQPGKKKARRGVRGGTKHKKKRSNSKHEQKDDVDQTVEEVLQIAKEPPMEPDIVKINGTLSTDVADVSGPIIQIGHLKVYTDTVLGFGSHGTMVYKGSFGGRDVAVKRMLLEFYAIASHEVGLLQESDDHPNVIRYYDKESSGEFLYIALELCPASLQDVIEKPTNYPALIGPAGLDLPDVLKQITAGVRYLHSLKIVHRDIKPQNILVSAPKKSLGFHDLTQPPRLLISDFGLCKKLEGDQNSFRATTAHAAGTSGWRAPELLVDDEATIPVAQSPTTASDIKANGNTAHSGSEPAVVDPQTNRRATRAIDIFSLGCVFYYVLTGGNHPFDRDGKYMREANIVKDNYNLSDLENLGDWQWEAKDLVARMLSHEPWARPDASQVLCHPFFWSEATRLEFLCDVSDQFEFEPRDPPSPALVVLESYADTILRDVGGDFLRRLPQWFTDTLGKQRKYQGGRLLDLLRALRNKKHHYEDMPDMVKERVGPLPGGYLGFWTRQFPALLMACHEVVGEVGWEGKDRFRKFFGAT